MLSLAEPPSSSSYASFHDPMRGDEDVSRYVNGLLDSGTGSPSETWKEAKGKAESSKSVDSSENIRD